MIKKNIKLIFYFFVFKVSKTKIIFFAIFFLALPLLVGADTLGEEAKFSIDPSYDSQIRRELTAILVKVTDRLYFYADKVWWQNLSQSEKQNLEATFQDLGIEFERKIYPTLTKTFGLEAKVGIDGSEKITVLLHPMISEAGGYFNSGDAYSRFQYPRSNERKIVYLNSRYIDKPQAKALLAHEFMHLITINQKELLRNVRENTWLNEARSEYVATFLGYDDIYEGSQLGKRVNSFLDNPSNSLTEWLNENSDYGVVNLFTQYLVDHYGVKILVDSLQSDKIGIDSINFALERSGVREDFSQIFTNWTIAVLVNDCQLGSKYCYLNENLKDLKIPPVFYYLPFTSGSALSVLNSSKEWAGNWQRIFGGQGTLTLEFEGQPDLVFETPYLLCDSQEKCQVNFLSLDENQGGELVIPEFNNQYSSLTIITSIQNKKSGFDGREPFYSFSWRVAVSGKNEGEDSDLKKRLLARIAELQAEVRRLQANLAALRGDVQPISCQKFENDLYFGMRDSAEVSCLQQFLKDQGTDIYPEGLVTGNFLSLTQAAVIRFQEEYAEEILHPLRLQNGTGYVGEMTRVKMNQLLP